MVSEANLDLLKWSQNIKCPWNTNLDLYSSVDGNLYLLKWMQENWDEYDHNESICAYAACDDFDILKLLRKYNCPWDETSCSSAASTGNLEILQWLRENKCPWDKNVVNFAASNGHLNILK